MMCKKLIRLHINDAEETCTSPYKRGQKLVPLHINEDKKVVCLKINEVQEASMSQNE